MLQTEREQVKLDTRKLFCEGGEQLARRLPREAIEALSLGVFKARFDGAIKNLFSGSCPCPRQVWN